MPFRRPNLVSVATVAASIIAFAAGGHFVAQAIIEGQQAQRLQELTETRCAAPKSRSTSPPPASTRSQPRPPRLRPVIAATIPPASVSALRRQGRAPRQSRRLDRLLGLFGDAGIRQGLGRPFRHARHPRQQAAPVPRRAVRRRRARRAQGRRRQARAGRHHRHQLRPVRRHAEGTARTQRGRAGAQQSTTAGAIRAGRLSTCRIRSR